MCQSADWVRKVLIMYLTVDCDKAETASRKGTTSLDVSRNNLEFKLNRWMKQTRKHFTLMGISLRTSVVLLFILVLPGHVAMGEKRRSDEERLLDYLFTDYNPSARPVLNSSKTVGVDLMFSLMHIQELVSDFFTHRRMKVNKMSLNKMQLVQLIQLMTRKWESQAIFYWFPYINI